MWLELELEVEVQLEAEGFICRATTDRIGIGVFGDLFL